MIYKWKIPGLIPVDAQLAGEELERIYMKHGGISPEVVVYESRGENAPLHPCFEWDDKMAAEKYRASQAQHIIRSIVVTAEARQQSVEVRAFVHTKDDYEPIAVVVNDKEKMERLMQQALREMANFRDKYAALKELEPVFEAIEQVRKVS